jgi:hypothetical protein
MNHILWNVQLIVSLISTVDTAIFSHRPATVAYNSGVM